MPTEALKPGQVNEAPTIALSDLAEHSWGIIERLDLVEELQNQLMHMGFMPGAPVQSLRRAPAGDPTVYAIDSSEVALRRETARLIFVRPGEPAARPRPVAAAEEHEVEKGE